MMADAVPLTPVATRRLHLGLSVGMALLGVVFLYWVGLAAEESLDSTFVARSVWHMAAVQLGGGIMLLVGLGSSIVHPDRVIGLVVAGLGLTWLAPEVAGWVDGALWIRSAVLPLGVMFVPLLLHIGLRYPIGRNKSRLHRRLTTLAYSAGTTVALAVALLYEPFLDLHCWRNCSSSPYVLLADPGLSRSMIRVSMWTAAALSVVVVWGVSARVLSRSPREPGVSRWLLGSLAVLAMTEVAYPLLVLHRPRVDPSDPVVSSLVLVGGILLAAIGLGIAWDLMHDVRRRRSLADLATELEAGASSSLASALANSLGDTTVEVAYWIPSLQRHVDSEGRGVSPTSGLGRAVVTLERAGVELGKVTHGSRLSAGDLEREIGAAARLAVDNERLRAELLAQANEIRVSQERIVAAGDDARRRLERDLHDGAQQSLLALSYKLRIAETEARRAGADKWAAALSGATGDVLTTIEEVRRLAHGIFPSILVDAGLIRALETLREELDVQLEIDLLDEGCGDATAMAVYQLVVAMVNAAWMGEGERISICGQKVDGRLIVDVDVQEPVAASALIQAVDRIGALGGTVGSRETGVHVELPCG